LRKNRRNASVFASEFFESETRRIGEFLSNERFLVLDYTLSELLAVRRPDERRRRRLFGLLGCVSVTRVSSMEEP
jgi:hypothetical protein